MNARMVRYLTCAALAACGCNVESKTDNTGGVEDTPAGECPNGTAVVLSDYVSTQIALSDLEGNTLSESFLSTGSTETDGLSFALSGDVALPSNAPSSGRVVLLDRFGTNVITWADAKTANVLAQLAVGTGFESNPSDYLEIDATRAFVTRWGDNATPGMQDFDGGGDVLVIDTESYAITGAIELPRRLEGEADDFPPRPTGMTRVGDTVLVSLNRLAADYASVGPAALIGVSIPDQDVAFELPLAGLKSCGRAALSPNGKRLAVACTGSMDETGAVVDLAESAVVLLDASVSPPTELQRFATEDLGVEGLQDSVVFASDEAVLLKTQTAFGGSGNNRWIALNLETSNIQALLEARPDDDGNGKGIVFGGMSCAPGCSDTCLLADADRGVLERVTVSDSGELSLGDSVQVETRAGLAPRDVSVR